MMNRSLVLALLLSLGSVAHSGPVATKAKAPAKRVVKTVPSKLVPQARQFLTAQDFLGFRIWIRSIFTSKISRSEWYAIKNLISAYAPRAGFDLVPLWNSRFPAGRSEIDLGLDAADDLMQARKFQEAFVEYQKLAQKLKALEKTRGDSKRLQPYVVHQMARALYAAGRFEESLTAYQWIAANYPWFRQVLFEKMWAAFKAGRVDLALGAVASQRSVYFSKYISPEAYLIQAYLYKKLCREEDLKQVQAEMKEYEKVLQGDGMREWAAGDVETLTLLHISELPARETDLKNVVNEADRIKEQTRLKDALKSAYEKRRPKILTDLRTAMAYAQLAKVTDTRQSLKPVTKLKSRDDLLKQNLEVWPADDAEEWMDELGRHVLIGESECGKPKP